MKDEPIVDVKAVGDQNDAQTIRLVWETKVSAYSLMIYKKKKKGKPFLIKLK